MRPAGTVARIDDDGQIHLTTQCDDHVEVEGVAVVLPSAGRAHAALAKHDFAVASLLFAIFGFSMMFGATQAGWIGPVAFIGANGELDSREVTFFVFQMMFCGTATTIVSGAVAERMRFGGYLVVAAVLSGLVYTVFGHWAWNGLDGGPSQGWLPLLGHRCQGQGDDEMTDTDPTIRQDFDSPWKEAMNCYFPACMAFFFPKIHASIDWTRDYKFLDNEFQSITRDAVQGRRYVDKLVQVFLNDGCETWLIIHVEVQGQANADFPERMFVYHYRILDRYQKKAVSLGVLSDPEPGFRPHQFISECFGCRIDFTFPIAKVLDYGKNWAELEQSNNPFAVVVMAHLKAQEIRDGLERKEWKLRLIRMLYERGFKRKDILELFRFIDWLLILPPELETEFFLDLQKIEEENKMEFITSVERIGIEKGVIIGVEKGVGIGIEKGFEKGVGIGIEKGFEKGLEQGMLQSLRSALLEVLSIRFEERSTKVIEIVEQITDTKLLQQLYRQTLQCKDLNEFMTNLAATSTNN